MLAGWTERKQALHDMLASTLVVFRDVRAGPSAADRASADAVVRLGAQHPADRRASCSCIVAFFVLFNSLMSAISGAATRAAADF